MAVMERDQGWMGFICHSVAVLLLLCSFALNSICVSLPKASRTVEPEDGYSVAEVLERRTGRILFNGKELENQPRSAPAAENEEMMPVDLYQSDSTELPVQTSQLETEVTEEATWRLLNTSLFCDQMKGVLEASGPAATDLQVIMGDGYPQPLIEVALTCGYLLQQDSHGLVLEVPFDSCGVIPKDGCYVLPMIWRETPIELTCPILMMPDATPAPTNSELDQQQPGDAPDQDILWSSTRSKRYAEPAISPYDPRGAYYPYMSSYYLYMSSLAQNAAPSTDVATVNDKPAPQTPVQTPNYKPYQYSQYPYYGYNPYYTLPSYQTSVASGYGTPVADDQYYQAYYQPYYYPYANPPVQPESPDNPDVYYYPIIQHYYGRNPNQLTTTKAPTKPQTTTTAKPCTTTTTRRPCTAAKCTTTTTKAPCTTTTTRAPCTAAPCTTTTTKPPCTATTCSKPKTTTASRCYPGRNCPFVAYGREPFKPIISYGRSLKIPAEQEYAPDASYQSEVVPPVEMQPGLQWESVPWFPRSTDQGVGPFDWKSLQPRRD